MRERQGCYLVEHALSQGMQETETFVLIQGRFSDAVEQIKSLLSTHGLRTRFVHRFLQVWVLESAINPGRV